MLFKQTDFPGNVRLYIKVVMYIRCNRKTLFQDFHSLKGNLSLVSLKR